MTQPSILWCFGTALSPASDNFKYKLQIPQPVRKEDIKLHLNAFVKIYSPILCFNEKNQIRALGEIGTDSSKVALLYIDEGRNEAWSILNMRIQLLQDVSWLQL